MLKQNDNANDLEQDADTPSRDVVIIGESSQAGTEVSMKVLQNIYNEITGGSEELNKGYDKPFCVEMNDFIQLNHKFKQVIEQYNIQSQNCSVKVYHFDDTRETFSSFERFEIYNSSHTSPVESILVKYNFLIILPKLKRAQSYTVSIRVASRVSIMKKMRRREISFPKPILRLMGGQTAIVSINYVDYTVARSFLNVAESWFDGLPITKQSCVLQFIKKNSEVITVITKYGLGILAAYVVYQNLPYYLKDESTSLLMLSKVHLMAFVFMFSSYQVGKYLGKIAEYSVDDIYELAYVKLNRGDEKLIEEVKYDNKKSIIKATVNLFIAFLIGVAASVVANLVSS